MLDIKWFAVPLFKRCIVYSILYLNVVQNILNYKLRAWKQVIVARVTITAMDVILCTISIYFMSTFII